MKVSRGKSLDRFYIYAPAYSFITSMITICSSIMKNNEFYDCTYRGNTPEGRKGTRCRRVANGTGSYYSSVQIEFEDGVQLLVNRNAVKTVVFRRTSVTQFASS